MLISYQIDEFTELVASSGPNNKDSPLANISYVAVAPPALSADAGFVDLSATLVALAPAPKHWNTRKELRREPQRSKTRESVERNDYSSIRSTSSPSH